MDVCEESHESGSGLKEKTNLHQFNARGLMVLVCRHDNPIFLANIDTPGEQQKYPMALIQPLFEELGSAATVRVMYDVGCVLD